jgi:Uma2 family endonuclease
MSVGQALVTAEEFKQIAHEHDGLVELVRGEVIEMSRAGKLHGLVCGHVAFFLMSWSKSRESGWVMTNDVGVLTERDPDSVRGPDVLFIRKERLPSPGDDENWLTIPPDLCVEVLSPNDRWSEVIEKISEYFHLGVPEVWVLDPQKHEVQIHLQSNGSPDTLRDGDTLTSERLPGFECAVSELFEGC